MASEDHVYVLHAVSALLAQRPGSIKKLLLARGAKNAQLDGLIENTVAAGVAVQTLSRSELDALMPGARHQGVIAVVRAVSYERNEKTLPDFLAALTEPALLLVLDGADRVGCAGDVRRERRARACQRGHRPARILGTR